ncbi:MAG: hypothetical protein D6736_00865 [Nitrospinota bacterium]|nr:MAG: hypothetical protein D6736_00865 [Nitrospinota bacterium]
MLSPRQRATTLAYAAPEEMCFGFAPHPVRCGHDLLIGGGTVLPEVNFTLPPVSLDEQSFPEVRQLFQTMATRILQRALRLNQPSLVLEFEHLYEFTDRPAWGALITADLRKILDDFYQRYGLQTALRVTVADIREQERPPRMRTGAQLVQMLQAFEQCADAGADILSIESTGGKELFDQALLLGDIEAVVFAMGVLACRDMEFLWRHIVDIARRYDRIPGGDTDCAHANTAMHLAHQGMMPKVLAALIRLLGSVRSLVACEMGATGPLKDCGYENPIIKAIMGVPISMEGKGSACAHSSPLGNITAAVCDLWSNESVQDVRLLGGFAPEVFTEILIYDCRLMNAALRQGTAPGLRDLFCQADRAEDPQSWMMDLPILYATAQRIVEVPGEQGRNTAEIDYQRTRAVAHYACTILSEASRAQAFSLSPKEERWLERLTRTIETLPESGEELRMRVESHYPSLFLPAEYGLTN